MRLRKFILSILVVMGGLTASAQDKQPSVEYIFQPHFYIQAQPVGIQYTLGEINFGDLLSYNVQLAGGYQFTPVFGARLAINAFQSKAGQKFNDLIIGMPGKPNTIEVSDHKWSWNYIAPTVDATFNMTNLLLGYNPNRLFNFSLYAGIGANIAWNNGDAAIVKNTLLTSLQRNPNWTQEFFEPLAYIWDGTKCRFVGQFGANADFRITDALSVGLEVSVNTLSDHYNSKRAGNTDWYFNALLGAKFNLGQTHVEKQIQPVKYIHRVDTIYIKEPAPRQPATAMTASAASTAAPSTAAAAIEPLRRDIFFTIRATQVVSNEMPKVKDVADYMKKYPNSRVSVTGYADKGTGNVQINNRLAEKRAKVVTDLLVQKYGIDRSRITTDSKGHFEQPYPNDNDKNRVTVCIAQ